MQYWFGFAGKLFFFLVWAQRPPPSEENAVGISFDEKQYLHIYTKVKKSKNTIFNFETKFADSLKVVIDSHLLSCLQKSQKHV